MLKILEMLASSEGTLPLDFLTRAFGLVPDCRETRNIINRVNEMVSCMLYLSDDMVIVFHTSFLLKATKIISMLSRPVMEINCFGQYVKRFLKKLEARLNENES